VAVERLPASSPPPRDAGAAPWEPYFQHLEDRMDRLDRTVGAAVDLLHRLLHPDKQSKPGGPLPR
jgi:hypothetical protein